MKRLVLTAVLLGSSLMADNYGYNNPYSNHNDNDSNYEGSSGTKYKYDLSDPSDRIDYSTDVDAQMNDKLNAPINPGVGLDRSMGQYGGGIQDDN